jgi:hypothetical protein
MMTVAQGVLLLRLGPEAGALSRHDGLRARRLPYRHA